MAYTVERDMLKIYCLEKQCKMPTKKTDLVIASQIGSGVPLMRVSKINNKYIVTV